MAQNKHKTKRRIICILCASIIALYALAIPIGAVVNSSQVPVGSTALYGVSTFPFTVGFVQRDEALDRNYIFATEIGGLGQNGNQTVEGDDIFYWNYPDASDEESSSINYTQGDTVWLDSLYYTDINPSSGSVGHYKGGYSSIDLQYNQISSDFVASTESIIFKANNIYYNPIWLTEEGYTYEFKDTEYGYDTMIPMVFLPALYDYNTQKFVGAYSVEATVIDMNGERHLIRYSKSIDTSGSIVGVAGIPFISPDVLKQFINPEDIEPSLTGEVDGSNSTICIEEYRGYLDVDYYEYSENSVDDSVLAGTWLFNSNVNIFTGRSAINMYFDFPDANIVNCSRLTNVERSTDYFYSTRLYFRKSNASEDIMYRDGSFVNENYRTILFKGNYGAPSADGVPSDYWMSEANALNWVKSNAVKLSDNSTVAEEGTWEKVTDSELLNKVRVTYPRYDTSGVPDPSIGAQTWLAYPTAEKMLSGVISKHQPDEVIIPEIDEEMYKDYTGWLGTAVKGFFDTPLLGGMSLGVIVGVIVMFGCAIALLKIFAGG